MYILECNETRGLSYFIHTCSRGINKNDIILIPQEYTHFLRSRNINISLFSKHLASKNSLFLVQDEADYYLTRGIKRALASILHKNYPDFSNAWIKAYKTKNVDTHSVIRINESRTKTDKFLIYDNKGNIYVK